jgi:hypothetical protein
MVVGWTLTSAQRGAMVAGCDLGRGSPSTLLEAWAKCYKITFCAAAFMFSYMLHSSPGLLIFWSYGRLVFRTQMLLDTLMTVHYILSTFAQ